MKEKTPIKDASKLGRYIILLKLLCTGLLVAASSGCQSLSTEVATAPLRSTTFQTPLTVDVNLTPVKPSNLFDVIRDELVLPVDSKNPRIRSQLNAYSHNQHHFDQMLERAQPYLYFIVEEVKKRDMPMEFALVPMIESAFDPFAYSFAGAAGLWQFIPSTGRYYGLRQDWWYDGRRDVIASTEAALDYLKKLHGNFKSWELALAAYNSGFGTVSNAIRRNKKAGKPTNFWALSLPKETSAYVPKMLALGAILRDPAKYNLKIDAIPNEPYFEIVDTGQQIDLSRAAELAGISEKQVYQLNPGFNRWATSPDGPHRLLIPTALAEGFRETLAQLPTEERLRLQRYKIAPGDSLSVIARRFDTTTDIIKSVNHITNNHIVSGKTLMIPGPSMSFGHSRAGRGKINYVVRKGDNFSHIAKRHKVSVANVAKWNNLSTKDVLRIGQKLVIWDQGKSIASRSVIRKVHYRVRRGDNLSVIASRYGVRVRDIRDWNTIKKPTIRPGDNLTLYVDVTKNL